MQNRDQFVLPYRILLSTIAIFYLALMLTRDLFEAALSSSKNVRYYAASVRENRQCALQQLVEQQNIFFFSDWYDPAFAVFIPVAYLEITTLNLVNTLVRKLLNR